MLSRVRTGMPKGELTRAIPVIERLETTCAADGAVTEYAARDAKRF